MKQSIIVSAREKSSSAFRPHPGLGLLFLEAGMKYLIVLMMLATLAVAGFDIGIGMSVMTESQSAADYGWTGTASSNLDLFGAEWTTRAIGAIHYPAYDLHPIMSGTIIQTGMLKMDEDMGMEAGAGMQYAADEWNPVIYYGWAFELASGHDIRPFVLASLSDAGTVQAGFLIGFGN